MIDDDDEGFIEKASGVIDNAEFKLKLLGVFDFSRDDFPLSDTRLVFVFADGIDGVIDRDFGRSGSFKFKPAFELYLSNFVIETEAVLPCFELVLVEALLEDFDGFDVVGEVIVVVVIDNELLIRFCCKPNR